MSRIIHCPSCSQRYQVAEDAGGKRFRCPQCGSTFAVEPVAAMVPPTVPVASSGWSLDADLSQLPAAPSPTFWAESNRMASISNPSGGPTDAQMRLICCGMLALAALVTVASIVLQATQGTVYLAVLIIAPMMLVLGIAGLISPNVVRAAGKYGGHLPWQYKAASWGVMGMSFLLTILLIIGLFVAGFQPDRPGGRNRRPGLTRSQTATVVERIRASHAASPNANVVRKVSFPVFRINKPNPQAEAERVLRDVPGYVGQSCRLSADQKILSFEYRGDKQIASQYALLLPGPTGIYLSFAPTFEE